MLIMALAGTSVWAYTLRQLSSAPAAKTAAVTKLAPQHRIATPAETAASTPVTMTPTESPATAVAQSQPKAPTKQTMASKAITQAAQPITASITPTPTPRKPLQIAAANTSANAANTPTPALKLDTELASVQRIVPFAVSTAAFGPQGRKALAEILPLAKQAERVNVRGRTDSSGDQKKNRELAKSRATSVMFAFVAEGVSRKTLKATYCTKCFIASNDTEQGRRTNRRVDIELVMPAKLALHLPKPIHSAPDIDSEPVLLARLDEQFTSIGRRN
jgi:outer membrane protein OmpA-like peptidoglycan-associated protein